MTQLPAPENQKGFFQNDRKLVCSMLVVYSFCILGAIAVTFWGLGRRNLTISANATATANAVATQVEKVTATVSAHMTEQAGYEFVERFDNNENNWRRKQENSEYWYGYTTIQDGVYLWKVKETKDGFISWSDFSLDDRIGDFDVYVDTKVVEGELGDVCSGFCFGYPLLALQTVITILDSATIQSSSSVITPKRMAGSGLQPNHTTGPLMIGTVWR